jgi:putative endonuclease
VTEKPVYWVYMLRLDNGSYYTGYTRDLEKRVRDHRRGRGSKITRSFAPVAVAACWRLRCGKSAAMRLEAWIKSRTRQVKQSLVEHPESLPPDRPDTQGAAEGAAARAYRPPPAAPPHPPAGSAARRPADPIDQF